MAHNDSMAPKKLSGFGYKIFRVDGKSVIRSTTYSLRKDGWTEWNNAKLERRFPDKQYGFCVMKTKRMALKAAHNWGEYSWSKRFVVYKVEYEAAFAEHMEAGFVNFEVPMLLVKRFRKIERVQL